MSPLQVEHDVQFTLQKKKMANGSENWSVPLHETDLECSAARNSLKDAPTHHILKVLVQGLHKRVDEFQHPQLVLLALLKPNNKV